MLINVNLFKFHQIIIICSDDPLAAAALMGVQITECVTSSFSRLCNVGLNCLLHPAGAF